MTTPVEANKQQAILNDTETKRKELYDKVVSGEMDPKVANAAAKLLDGRDKQVVSQQRIEAEKELTSNVVDAAKDIIQEMRKQIGGQDIKKVAVPVAATLIIPDDPAPGQQVAAGSMEVGVAGEKFDEFQERMKNGEDFVQKAPPSKPTPAQ